MFLQGIEKIASGHSGALHGYHEGKKHFKKPLTTGQHAWHEKLHTLFHSAAGQKPSEYVGAVLQHITKGKAVWSGLEEDLPRGLQDIWNERYDGNNGGFATDAKGQALKDHQSKVVQSLKDLGKRQQENFDDMNRHLKKQQIKIQSLENKAGV